MLDYRDYPDLVQAQAERFCREEGPETAARYLEVYRSRCQQGCVTHTRNDARMAPTTPAQKIADRIPVLIYQCLEPIDGQSTRLGLTEILERLAPAMQENNLITATAIENGLRSLRESGVLTRINGQYQIRNGSVAPVEPASRYLAATPIAVNHSLGLEVETPFGKVSTSRWRRNNIYVGLALSATNEILASAFSASSQQAVKTVANKARRSRRVARTCAYPLMLEAVS